MKETVKNELSQLIDKLDLPQLYIVLGFVKKLLSITG